MWLLRGGRQQRCENKRRCAKDDVGFHYMIPTRKAVPNHIVPRRLKGTTPVRDTIKLLYYMRHLVGLL
jgi:hypothetical protein